MGGNRLFSLFNDPFNMPQQQPRIFRSESNHVALEVMPIPDKFTGDRWLPAKNLQIVESGLDQQAPALAGKPLMRRIMVLADGLTSAQLPSFEQTLPSGIKLYEERPQLTETPTRTGISSSRQTGMTLIATEPGQYDLPAIEIPWWNTETDRQEIARLAPVTVDIMPNPGVAASPQEPQIPQLIEEKTNEDDSSEATMTDSQPTTATTTSSEIHWLVWLFGIAWGLTLFAWWYSRRNNPSQPEQPAPAAEVEKIDSGKQAIAEALQQLEQAYTDKDAVATRAAWLAWAQLKWPESPPHNLTRLATRCDRAVAEAVLSLERTLYSPTDETGWADYEILPLIKQMQQKRHPDKQSPEGLVPLNP
jgi:hypothetical protein